MISIENIDCLEYFDKIEKGKFTHVITSPPYNTHRVDDRLKKYQHFIDKIPKYFDWLDKVISECIRVSTGNVFFNIQPNWLNKQHVFKIIGKYYKELEQILIWHKQKPSPSGNYLITNAYEFILVFGKDKLKSNNPYTENVVYTGRGNYNKDKFGAVMNKEVIDYIMDNFTKPGDIIFDPFMGTGTTAKACIERNNDCYGCEISEEIYQKCLVPLLTPATT